MRFSSWRDALSFADGRKLRYVLPDLQRIAKLAARSHRIARMLSSLVTNPTTPIASLIHLDSPLAFTLIYATHSAWPLVPQGSMSQPSNSIRISVLDSSFNPPTKAHLALANLGSVNKNNNDVSSKSSSEPPSSARGFDAQLLLLSIKNADKTPSSKDASTAQRLEMMRAMAYEMLEAAENGEGTGNIAVGCVLEPSFVGKSRVLKKALESIEESRNQEETSGSSTKLKYELGFAQGMFHWYASRCTVY